MSHAQLTADDIEALRQQGIAEGWTFTVGENPATQRSPEELCGLVVPPDWRKGRFVELVAKRDLPAAYDWRSETGCPPVRDQKSCGSCWAFSTVGALECNIKIKDGASVDLSEQWLVSCNRNGWDCDGGWYAHDYHEWKTDACDGTGAVLESEFPYAAADLPCDCPYPHEYFIESWAYVGGNDTIPDIDAMKQAILDYGPISVGLYANSAMFVYTGGIFNSCATGSVNHAVVLVGWDDNQGDNGVWIMRNSWGSGWGEDGYMRIPYGCNRIGYAACFVVYKGAARLSFDYPDGLPWTTYPGVQNSFTVSVSGVYGGVPLPGTGRLYYSIDDGTWHTVSMTELSPNVYEAALPALSCGSTIEYYISADEDSTGTVYNPNPLAPHKAMVATRIETSFADNFDTDKGWISSGDAVMGYWERGVPAGGGERGDPPTDYDGSGCCYLTDNSWGNSDIDDGTVTLISPVIHLSGFDGEIHYARWYYNDDPYPGSGSDQLKVFISNNGGHNWASLEQVGPDNQGSGGWYEVGYRISHAVTPTDSLLLKFEATDLDDGDIIEAAIDALSIVEYKCEDGPLAITSEDLSDWTEGWPYSCRIEAWGGLGELTWADVNSELDGTGLALTPDGYITGIPSTTGLIYLTVQVTDAYGGFDERQYDLAINPAPEITSASLGEWTVGYPMVRQVALSGGTEPVAWSNSDGILEADGLVINSSGTITGTPVSTGSIMPLILATDAAGAADTAELMFTVNPPVAITTVDLPIGDINVAYVQTLTRDGGTSPIVWSDSGQGLEGTGLSLSPDGILSGIVTVQGDYEFTAQVEDAAGSIDFADFVVVMYGPFVCGDANGDGETNIGDAVQLINCIFKGGPFPSPPEAGDANCDGATNVGDAVYIIAYVFNGGAEPCCP